MTEPVDPATPPQPPDPRSYAERYRGTEWGSPEPAPDIAPAEASRRRGGRLLVRIGVLLLLGSAVAGAALAATGGLDGILPGSPAASGGTGGASARPTTDPATAAGAIDAFLAVTGDPKLTYAVRITVDVTSGGQAASIVAIGKVAGQDSDLQMNMTSSESGVAFGGRVIVKGTSAWVQLDGQKTWVKGSLKAGEMVDTNVFAGIDEPADVVYVDRGMRRGSTTDHLVTTPGWKPATEASLAGTGLRIDSATMDIWVLPDGRPREARLVAQLSAGGLGQTGIGAQTGTLEATYVFDDVGERITIKAPR